MQSRTVDGSMVLFGNVYTSGGKPVMLSLLLNPQNKSGDILDYAVITSAYGRRTNNLQSLMDNSRIYYINENKNRTEEWLQALGLQLPSAVTKLGSIAKIADLNSKVNRITEKKSDIRYSRELETIEELKQQNELLKKYSPAQIREIIHLYAEAYGNVNMNAAQVLEEIVCDAMAEMNAFATEQMESVAGEVGRFLRDVQKAAQGTALEGGQKKNAPEGVKFSRDGEVQLYDYTKLFAEQIDDWKAGKIPPSDTLMVGKTPDVFLQIGFNNLPVTINQRHMDYALNGTMNQKHHIGKGMLKQLPQALRKPVAIIASETKNSQSVVALLPFQKNGSTVIAPVQIDGFGYQNSIQIDSNAVTSIYGRANALTKLLSNAIQKQNNGETAVFYLDTERAAALYSVARVTMPKMPSTRNGYVASITDADSPVKLKIGNVTESQQFKRWFGDWQNHPEKASKVVNEDGTPKLVYHQTGESFMVFETRHEGAGMSDADTPFGIFLKSSDKDIGLRKNRHIITEFGSILENAVKMGAPVPDWLIKMMKVSLAAINKKAEPVESKE